MFNNTEEAIEYGKRMSAKMVPVMKEFQLIHFNMSKSLLKRKKYDAAMTIGFKSQLYREAIEAFNGTQNIS